MTGYTDEVEKALFLLRFGVPFWGLTYVFGGNDNYWYNMTGRLAGLGDGFVHVVAGPGPAVARADPVDVAHALSRLDLAEAGVFVLEELEHADFHLAPPGAGHEAQRRRGLALALFRVDDD